MIRVLHLFTTLNNGGVESFLYNYYSNMNNNYIRFDEVVCGKDIGYMEPMFKKLGSRVFHVEKFKNNPLKHIISVAKIIKEGKYDVIHCHGYKSILGLIFANVYGCKVRIIHSHMAYTDETTFQMIFRKILVFFEKILATEKFACGIDAAKWLFGNKDYENGKVTIINNAIDLDKYSYNEEKRKKIRKELNVENEIVIGNVARLTYQKNQEFLLDIMKEIVKDYSDSKLVIIGEGEDREKIEKKSKELGLSNNVILLGLRKDVSDILSAIDIFVLPSRYEGLPVVLAEVQAAGIPSIASDIVTKEINVTNTIVYVSLDSSVEKWKENIINSYKIVNRKKNLEIMKNGKYDIKYQASYLANKYKELIEVGEK